MNLRLMMNASQFYALSRQLQNAYAAQMRPLCEETGMAQTAIDILLFLHNNPGCDTARDICTYRQLKPALVSLYVENLVQSGHLRRESVPEDRRKCRLLLTAQALPVVEKGLALQAAFTALISSRTPSQSPALARPRLMTMSISSAPFFTASSASKQFTAVVA